MEINGKEAGDDSLKMFKRFKMIYLIADTLNTIEKRITAKYARKTKRAKLFDQRLSASILPV